MLTVVDKPLIQYAVEECIASGIEHVIFVTGRRKSAIEDHFDFAPELESFLEERGKPEQAQMVHDISGGLQFSYTRQSEALGLGHAVLCAAELVGDEPFAVLLGDVIMEGAVPATRELMDIYEATGAGAIHVEECRANTCISTELLTRPREKDSRWGDRLLRIKDLGRKAERRKSAFESGRHRTLRPAAGNLRLPCENEARHGRRNSTDRWLCRLAEDNKLLGVHLRRQNSTTRATNTDSSRPPSNLGLKDPKLGKDFRAYLKGLKL